MTDPSVTVLMAVHNGQRFLQEAIEGILAQSLADFEFLIIDDGSDDRSSEIVASYADDRIRVITNPHNVGLTQCLNAGLRAARADLVARQDADDVSRPGRLEAQASALAEKPDAVLATSYCDLIDEDGTVFGHITPSPKLQVLRERFAGKDSPFPHGSVLFRRAPVLNIGGYDERFWYAQDFDLWVRLLAHGDRQIVVVPEVLYGLRKTAPTDQFKPFWQRRYAEVAWEQYLCGHRIDFRDVRRTVAASAKGERDGSYGPEEHWLTSSLTALKYGYKSPARLYARRAMENAPMPVKLRAAWRLLLSVLPFRFAGALQRWLWLLMRRRELRAHTQEPETKAEMSKQSVTGVSR